jgi:hypothetical protein
MGHAVTDASIGIRVEEAYAVQIATIASWTAKGVTA